MPLDPDMKALLDQMAAAKLASFHQMTPAAAREQMARRMASGDPVPRRLEPMAIARVIVSTRRASAQASISRSCAGGLSAAAPEHRAALSFTSASRRPSCWARPGSKGSGWSRIGSIRTDAAACGQFRRNG